MRKARAGFVLASVASVLLSAVSVREETGLHAAAQQQTPPAQPPVRFKVDVELVEIDAIVTDAAGRVVRGLTQKDFEILEEGKPQPIGTFAMVDIPIERADPPAFRAAPPEPDVFSNRREFDGRLFVVVLDDLQTDAARTARVRTAARQFVERYVGANDLVAIVQTSGAGGGQDFTASRQRLVAAIDRFIGNKLKSATELKIEHYRETAARGVTEKPKDTEDLQRAFRARASLSALSGVAGYLSGVHGRRKALVYFGEGIDYDIANFVEARDTSSVQGAMRDLVAAATRANVSIYSVDPRGLSTGMEDAINFVTIPEATSVGIGIASMQDELSRSHTSMRAMSEETGGVAFLNRNDTDAAFRRIVEENSTYYILGYYPRDGRRDGRYRRVQVRMTRPGLQVRARPGYVAPVDAKARHAAPSLNVPVSPELLAALQSPVPVGGLSLHVVATPFQGRKKNASLAVSVEVDPAGLTFTERNGVFENDVEVVIVPTDIKGKKARDGSSDTAELHLRTQTHALVMREGIRLTRSLDLPAGTYRLHVGVREKSGGSIGTVSAEIDVPDLFKPPLQMSGIALAAESNMRPTANPDPRFSDVLPEPPTAARTFPREDTLSVFAELYAMDVRTPHRIAIRTTVTADNGHVIFSSEDERRSEDLTSGNTGGTGGIWRHKVKIPIKGVAPGRYVLRVEAQRLVGDRAVTSRELEFQIR